MQVVPLLYVFTPLLDFADYSESLAVPPSIEWASGMFGTGLFISALWLLYQSHKCLADNWTPGINLANDHSLVTHGVYGRLRHPMYSAHILWAFAQALLLHNWIAGPAMLVPLAPFVALRVPREERILIEEYGNAYRQYMKETGRVLPKLSR